MQDYYSNVLHIYSAELQCGISLMQELKKEVCIAHTP